jgi:hypothetical protein
VIGVQTNPHWYPHLLGIRVREKTAYGDGRIGKIRIRIRAANGHADRDPMLAKPLERPIAVAVPERRLGSAQPQVVFADQSRRQCPFRRTECGNFIDVEEVPIEQEVATKVAPAGE